MPGDPPHTVQDAELIAWLRADSGDPRELIVQAVIPRTAAAPAPDDRQAGPLAMIKPSAPRDAVLSELAAMLEKCVDEQPVVLRSAGAVAVKATPQQMRGFAEHPLVKAIRVNRHLGKPRAAF